LVRIIVVGAGVIGCAVAFECARRGAKVRVLDARQPGRGATQAAAGMLAPYIEGHNADLRGLAVRGLTAWDPFMAVLHESGVAVPEYARHGTLQAAFTDDGARELTELAGLLADAGVEHHLRGGGAIRALEPQLSRRVVAALEIPTHGYVSPTPLVAALVDAAARCGATFSHARVLSIENGPSTARVATAEEQFDADAVVLATGSWLSDLAVPVTARPDPPVRPIRGQLLSLRTESPVASRVVWGPGCYVVPRQDGTVLVGATAEDVGFDERATLAGVRDLSTAASALIPALEQAVLEEVRVGLRPATPDELPIVGPSGTMRQTFYAAGHYRNGVLLAPLTARLVADLILDGQAREDLALLSPARFGL
jgi:glycine oxidase